MVDGTERRDGGAETEWRCGGGGYGGTDWFQPWPETALFDVAKRFLSDVDLGTPATKEAITKFMPFSFASVNKASEEYLSQEKRYNYTTPKSFLELIYLYKNMLASKRKNLEGNIQRLSNGLVKLEQTGKDVSLLMEQVQVKSAEVEVAKQKADEVAEIVGGEKAKVEVAAASASEEAAKTAVIAESASKMQASCEKDLEAAIPAVEKAEAALDTLNKKDLGELKSLAKPPPGVDDVTNAILAMRGEPPKSRDWNAAKNMMKDVNKFIEDLKSLKGVIDRSEMVAKNVDACRPYLALEHVANLEIMRKKSNAAAGLCDFLLNIVVYYDIVVTASASTLFKGAHTCHAGRVAHTLATLTFWAPGPHSCHDWRLAHSSRPYSFEGHAHFKTVPHRRAPHSSHCRASLGECSPHPAHSYLAHLSRRGLV